MADFNTSETKKNLEAAFAGESQASVKYGYYSKQAAKEGYQQIGAIFGETSHNENTHAKMWFKILHDGGNTPGKVLDTKFNLQDAAAGEHFEWTEMYQGFAETAKAEGFTQIAQLFEEVGKIEKHHDERYNQLIARLEAGAVFKRDGVKAWKCRQCGHIHFGSEAPAVCPVCGHPQAYFEELCENF
ncbi:MAG: rubrerythrin family protein [Coriobacteriales bacterium]|jgi:rubrerythrin|nr:rubrerythrin family protein [Coriobacteriales bacterium]